jgi:hypothetical protein
VSVVERPKTLDWVGSRHNCQTSKTFDHACRRQSSQSFFDTWRYFEPDAGAAANDPTDPDVFVFSTFGMKASFDEERRGQCPTVAIGRGH